MDRGAEFEEQRKMGDGSMWNRGEGWRGGWCGVTSNLTLPPNLFLYSLFYVISSVAGSGPKSGVILILFFLHPLYPIISSSGQHQHCLQNSPPVCPLLTVSPIASCPSHRCRWPAALPEPLKLSRFCPAPFSPFAPQQLEPSFVFF